MGRDACSCRASYPLLQAGSQASNLAKVSSVHLEEACQRASGNIVV